MSTEHEQTGFTRARKTWIGDGSWDADIADARDPWETLPRFSAGVGPGDRASSSDAEASLDTEPFLPRDELPPGAGATGNGAATAPPFAMPRGNFEWPVTVAGLRLAERVHQGRMSAVWRALDEARQASVAVKLVPMKLAPTRDERTLERLARLSAHPGLPRLFQHGSVGPWWYQISEWLDGETLASRGRNTELMPGHAGEIALWMREVASALDAHHRAGFVHGDVKPANVLIVDGHARLIDLVGLRFGASWNRHGGLTPAFASPEARDGAPADPRDDVYSLAAMSLHLLTGKQVDPRRATDGTTLAPMGLTPAQWAVLQAALDPDRERRLASPLALVEQVWPASASTVVVQPNRPRRLLWQHRWEIAAAAAVLALVVGLQTGQTDLGRSVLARWAQRTAAARADIPVAAPTAPPKLPVHAEPPRPERTAVTTRSNASDRPEPSAGASVRPELVAQPRTAEVATVPEKPDVPAAPERTEVAVVAERPRVPVHERPDVPVVLERPNIPVVFQRPEIPVVPSRPQVPVMPERPEIPAVPERPDVPVIPERPEIPVVPERPDIPVVPERPDIPVVPERPDIPVVPERPDIPVVPERPDIPAVPERPDIPVVAERPEIPAVPERPDRPEKPERPDKPDKPDRPEKPEHPDKP